jgi:hypothetical protein
MVMNALKARRRYDAEQMDLAWKKRQEEEEARVAAMSPEERKAYEADKAKRRMKTAQLLGLMSSISGPYSDSKLWR